MFFRSSPLGFSGAHPIASPRDSGRFPLAIGQQQHCGGSYDKANNGVATRLFHGDKGCLLRNPAFESGYRQITEFRMLTMTSFHAEISSFFLSFDQSYRYVIVE